MHKTNIVGTLRTAEKQEKRQRQFYPKVFWKNPSKNQTYNMRGIKSEVGRVSWKEGLNSERTVRFLTSRGGDFTAC